MAIREFIILKFESDEEFPMGYFLCQDAGAEEWSPEKIAFDDIASVGLYFDPEMLHYVLNINEVDISKPYVSVDNED